MSDIFNMADTWNAGGTTFTAIKMDVTDTASAAGSKLIDLLVGGVSKFAVDKAGVITSSVGTLISNMAETWNSGGTTFTAIKFNVTDTASASASLLIDLQVGGSTKFKVEKGGNTTVNGIFEGTYLRADGAGFIGFNGGTTFRNGGNGIIRVGNNADNDFTRFQFGGTTSSFPALKRSAAVLQSRLADDSAFCALQGILRGHANAVLETVAATHTIAIQDAAGTAYKVLVLAA